LDLGSRHGLALAYHKMVSRSIHRVSASRPFQTILTGAFLWQPPRCGVALVPGIRQSSKKTRQREPIAGIQGQDKAKNRGRNPAFSPPTSSRSSGNRLHSRQEAPAASRSPVDSAVQESRRGLSSTRPAPLILPEGPDEESDGSITLKSRASHLYKSGKVFISFYKTGFTNVWSNYKEYRRIRKKFSGVDIRRSIREGSSPGISRYEFQMYLRTRHDLGVLLPFGLLFLVCGEFTPLIVLAIGTAIVPYPCRIPQQVKKDTQNILIRIQQSWPLLCQEDSVPDAQLITGRIHGVDPFGLASLNVPIISPLVKWLWVYPRLQRLLDEIVCDALLIVKEGGAQQLEVEELFDFAVKIRDQDAMISLLDHEGPASGSSMSRSQIQRTQKEMQVFINGIGHEMQRSEWTSPYRAHMIFASADQALTKSK
jgi:hypothetical protein